MGPFLPQLFVVNTIHQGHNVVGFHRNLAPQPAGSRAGLGGRRTGYPRSPPRWPNPGCSPSPTPPPRCAPLPWALGAGHWWRGTAPPPPNLEGTVEPLVESAPRVGRGRTSLQSLLERDRSLKQAGQEGAERCDPPGAGRPRRAPVRPHSRRGEARAGPAGAGAVLRGAPLTHAAERRPRPRPRPRGSYLRPSSSTEELASLALRP